MIIFLKTLTAAKDTAGTRVHLNKLSFPVTNKKIRNAGYEIYTAMVKTVFKALSTNALFLFLRKGAEILLYVSAFIGHHLVH